MVSAVTLQWDGGTGDGKRAFVVAKENDGWKDLRIEVDTDDCDRKHAKAMMQVVIDRCNQAAALRSRVEELNGRVACLKNSLKRAADLLENVRTGEDFEGVCWEAAEEFRQQLRALLSQPSAEREKGVGL